MRRCWTRGRDGDAFVNGRDGSVEKRLSHRPRNSSRRGRIVGYGDGVGSSSTALCELINVSHRGDPVFDCFFSTRGSIFESCSHAHWGALRWNMKRRAGVIRLLETCLRVTVVRFRGLVRSRRQRAQTRQSVGARDRPRWMLKCMVGRMTYA